MQDISSFGASASSFRCKCFLCHLAQALPLLSGARYSFVRRKCFLCYPAQDIPSFGRSASSVRRKYFLCPAQVLPLLSGARYSFVGCKCFLCPEQDISSFGTTPVIPYGALGCGANARRKAEAAAAETRRTIGRLWLWQFRRRCPGACHTRFVTVTCEY